MRYGKAGAYWLLLELAINLRHTRHDLRRAAERIRNTNYPQAQEFAVHLTQPQSEKEMLELFSKAELKSSH
jgi:hypothetical protein